MMPTRSGGVQLGGERPDPEDLPDDPVPRCGYFFISTGPNDKFIPCCKMHDDMYGDKTHGLNQKQVDRIFYQCMLSRSSSRYDKWKAKLYYNVVRTLGFLFWIVLPLSLLGCGGDSEYQYDNSCTSCFATEDIYGNPGIVCSDSVPFGVVCYGGLKRLDELQESD